MSDSGFAEEALARLHDRLAWHVESGQMPGLISLVARNGEPHVDVVGTPSFGDPSPLRRDAIFRIASLTKPISAAAAMMLVDDGVLHLDDAVDHYLPELADRRVLRELGSELDDTVPAKRSITTDDLLSFRLGFGVVRAPPGTYPIQVAEQDLQLKTLGPPWPPTPHAPDEWMRRFGSLPLMHQPGESWMYNTGSQILGVLIERAAGKPLDAFMRERLFEPLGMTDTGFSVPADQMHRLTTAYAPDPASDAINVLDAVADSYWSQPPAFPNASGWLVSTIDDFWAFVSMLLADGKVGGEQILSSESIALMTTDRLTAEQRAAARLFVGEHSGWGLGMATPAAGDPMRDVPHGFGWTGGSGTVWYSDPDTGLTGVLLTQRGMTSPQPPAAMTDFWRLAYDALVN
jgi:CubicO group peptidase (beta-lactamase class C family)